MVVNIYGDFSTKGWILTEIEVVIEIGIGVGVVVRLLNWTLDWQIRSLLTIS